MLSAYCSDKKSVETDILKRSVNQKAKVISSSSECDTVQNSVKDRKRNYFQHNTEKEITKLDHRKNSVKRNKRLSAYSSDKESKESDFLKKSINRNAKAISRSSECDTVENSSINRKRNYFQRYKKRMKTQTERSLLHCSFSDNNSSDSMVCNSNSSLAITVSNEQSPKKRKIELSAISKKLLNKPVEEKENHSTCKHELFCSSETKKATSDNTCTFINSVGSKRLKHKQCKCSFNVCKHTMAKRSHLSFAAEASTEDKEEIDCISLKKSGKSGLLCKESNNYDGELECNKYLQYKLKPCSVLLVRLGINDLHQNDSPKAMPKMNFNAQTDSSKMTNVSNISKRLKNIGKSENFIFAKGDGFITNSDNLHESEKAHTENFSDKKFSNVLCKLKNSSRKFDHGKSSKNQLQESELYSSDCSHSLPPIQNVLHNSEFLKESESSGDSDSNTEDCNSVVSDETSGVVNQNDEGNSFKNIKIASTRNDVPPNGKKDKFVEAKLSDDIEAAYFADIDEDSNSYVSTENCNFVSKDSCKKSAGLSENLSENELGNMSKVLYCYLGPKTCEESFDEEYFVRSKVNGSVYNVDYFQYDSIHKMFVTICSKENTSLYSNNHHVRNITKTVSERIESLGGFVNGYKELHLRKFKNLSINLSENKDECVPSSASTSHSVDKDDSLNTQRKYSESIDDVHSEPGPSHFENSWAVDLVTSDSTCSDSSEEDQYDSQCVHCSSEFSNKHDNYYHICIGKLQKGFLCRFCEQIFSSMSKFKSHKEMHFI